MPQKKTRYPAAAAFALSLAFSHQAFATPSAPPDDTTMVVPEEQPENIPEALKKTIAAGAQINYLGRVNVLRAYEITKRKSDGTLLSEPGLVTPDGSTLIIGSAFVNGRDVTRYQIERLMVRITEFKQKAPLSPPLDINVPAEIASTENMSGSQKPQISQQQAPQETPLSQPSGISTISLQDQKIAATRKKTIDQILGSTANFNVGTSGTQIFLVTSPNCEQCMMAWKQLEPAVKSGQINVTIILVADTPVAQQISEEILHKQDPDKAWEQYENTQTLNQTSPTNGFSAQQIETVMKVNNRQFLESLQETPRSMPLIISVTATGQIQKQPALSADIDQVVRNSTMIH